MLYLCLPPSWLCYNFQLDKVFFFSLISFDFCSPQKKGSPFGRVHGGQEDLDGILSAAP